MKREFKTIGRFLFRTVLILLLAAYSVYAQNNSAEVTKNLGTQLPLNLTFINSEGKQILLKDLVKKPTVIDFVYYRCAGICTPLMMEVSDVIGKVDYEPGKDYDVISISIDQNETTKMAAEKKRAMIGLSDRNIPDSAWSFLTGDSSSIYN